MRPLTPADLSDFERRVQETLRSGGDARDTAAADEILSRGIRLLHQPLNHVGAAYELKNRKIIRVDAGFRSAIDQAAAVLHELTHLRQGIPRCFLLMSEIEAWQRQWEFLHRRTGRWWWEGLPGWDAGVLQAFMTLPLSGRRYLLPDTLRLRWGRTEKHIRLFPLRSLTRRRDEGTFPLSVTWINLNVDTARRTMKSVDAGYLANLLFPWPMSWLWNRQFWRDTVEGIRRLRRSP